MGAFSRKWVPISLLAGCWLAWGASQSEARSPDKPGVGLLPVYNASGEPYGDVFSAFLTVSLFDALSKQGWDCVFLNPGGLHSPLNITPALEHAKKAGVSWIIFLTLNPARRDRYADAKPEIEVEGRVVGVEGGVEDRVLMVRREVKRKHLDGGFDIGPHPRIPRGAAATNYSLWYWYQVQSSRRLSKQPLGKAVLKTAIDLRSALAAALPAFPRRVLVGSPSPCDLEFRVADRDAKWASKSYTVVVNGRDESAAVRGGVLTFRATPGVVVFEVRLKDAPFQLPIQPAYLANTFLECSGTALRLEIGPKGEALLIQEPSPARR